MMEAVEESREEQNAYRRVVATRWVGLVVNARSGTGRGRVRVERLRTRLGALGWDARIAWTPEERSQLVADSTHDAGCRCLVAVGGDGTVAALIAERPRVAILTLPSGTENLFAQHFGHSRRTSEVATLVDSGQVRTVDLGCARGRPFALMVGFGFDAEVVTRHHQARLREDGIAGSTHRAAYVEPILRASLSYRFPRVRVCCEGPAGRETIEGSTVFVFNLPRYALGLPFAPQAREDDGLLNLVVFQKPGPFHALRYLWLVLRGRHLGRRSVQHRLIQRAWIESDHAVPVQMDGDPAGVLQPGAAERWLVEVLPRSLQVLVAENSHPNAKE